MPLVTPNQIANYAAAAGFSGKDLAIAVAIALAESSGSTSATHKNNNGSTDYGLWQINSIHPEILNMGNWSNGADNAVMAHTIYINAGNKFTDWTTFNTGAYSLYLPQAAIAAATANAFAPSTKYTINGVTIGDPVWKLYLDSSGYAKFPGFNRHGHGTNAMPDGLQSIQLQSDGSQVQFTPNDDLSAAASMGHIGKDGKQISRIDFDAQSRIVDYAGPDNISISGDPTKQTGAGAKELPLLGIPDAIQWVGDHLNDVVYMIAGGVCVLLGVVLLAKSQLPKGLVP